MNTNFRGIAIATVAIASLGATSVVFAIEFSGGRGEPSRFQPEGNARFEDEPSPYQQAILADGHVTDTEMSAAVDDTLTCLREKGLDASIPPGKPGPDVNRAFHIVTWDYSSPGPVVTECKKQFMDQVEWRYGTERDTRTPASRETIGQMFAGCMTESGFAPVPAGVDAMEFWNAARLSEAGVQPGGHLPIRACFNKIGHLKPE